MNRFGVAFFSLLALGAFGCSSSSTEDGGADGSARDGDITFDAGPMMDAAVDMPTVDMHVAQCGDGRLDPGEMCDNGHLVRDGGTTPPGCDDMCHRTSFCGDNHVDTGEQCDDGENFSCDGCAANCQLEECGNGHLDCGELCDGTPGCATTGATACHAVTTCGNATVDPGEQCDPAPAGTPMSFDGDGCGRDCLLAQDMVIDTLQINGTGGCDYTGDGVPDNAFGRAFGVGTAALNMQLQSAIANGNAILLLSMMGLNDTTATNDPDVRVAWIQGQDADMDATNNLHGMGTFYASMGSFDATSGDPNTAFGASITSHMLAGGPEDVSINLAAIPIPLDLRQARISGTLAASMMSVTDLSDGLLCGAIPVSTIAPLPNFLAMFGGMPPPPCDMTVADTNLGDVLIGGAIIPMFGLRIGGVQPDVDLDHDGLEHFEVTGVATGGICQPVVTACIDGDGTRIAGHDCITATVAGHPRFNDGWSSSFGLTAVHAQVLGIRP